MFCEGDLTIRPWRSTDVEPLRDAVLACREDLSTWLGWCPPGYGTQQARSWVEYTMSAWKDGRDFNFVILDNKKVVGGVGLTRTSRVHRVAELGYWLAVDGRGKGFATRATQWVARAGLELLDLNRVELLVATGNLASQRVCKRAGAMREGVLRSRIVLRDSALDAVVFSLTSADLQSLPDLPEGGRVAFEAGLES